MRRLQEVHVDPTGRGGTAGRDSTPLSSPARHFKRAHRRLQKKNPCHLPGDRQREREKVVPPSNTTQLYRHTHTGSSIKPQPARKPRLGVISFIKWELIQLTKVAAVKSLLRSPGCCASTQQRTTAAGEEGPTHVIHCSRPLAGYNDRLLPEHTDQNLFKPFVMQRGRLVCRFGSDP